MSDIPAGEISMFIEACHDAARRGLMKCSSGNMSKRIDKQRLMVSATRSWLERIGREHVSICSIAEGKLLEGPKPTVELAFHREIIRRRPEINVVMHFQSPFATTLACSGRTDIDYFVIPEIPFYIGPIGYVPYYQPGSAELAAATVDVMVDYNMAVMDHHGLVTVAEDYDHAIQNAVFFELACEVIVRSGGKVLPLDKMHAQLLRDAGMTGSEKV